MRGLTDQGLHHVGIKLHPALLPDPCHCLCLVHGGSAPAGAHGAPEGIRNADDPRLQRHIRALGGALILVGARLGMKALGIG